MGRPALRYGVTATALLSAVALCARGQEAPEAVYVEPPAPSPSRAISAYDRDQETPAAPATPAPGPDPYPEGPSTDRFLLGDFFDLRPTWEDRGFSFYTSFTQFEQGVASGGFEQAFRWGGKFDMLAHVDGGKAGLWEGGTFDLFVESRLVRFFVECGG